MPSGNAADDELLRKGVGNNHLEVLRKMEALQGMVIEGEEEIRGAKGSGGHSPDSFVHGTHRLHGLIRGIYVPAGDKYALSILLTEKETNYGKELTYFSPDSWRVMYKPPRDARGVADTKALERCARDDVPVGVIRNLKKGENMILGLGSVTQLEGPEFSIVPTINETSTRAQEEDEEEYLKRKLSRGDYSAPDVKTTRLARAGQRWFRQALVKLYGGKCAFCGFDIEGFLIAAHVVPYALDRENRLNPRNGLLLCRLCDTAFETGLTSLTPELEITVSSKLVQAGKDGASISWLSRIKRKIGPLDPSLSPESSLLAKHDKIVRGKGPDDQDLVN